MTPDPRRPRKGGPRGKQRGGNQPRAHQPGANQPGATNFRAKNPGAVPPPDHIAARRRTAAIVTLICAIVGIALVTVGAIGGVNAALAGGGADFFVVLFVLGALTLIATVIRSIIGLMRRGGNRALWISSLVVGVLPAAAVVVVNLTR